RGAANHRGAGPEPHADPEDPRAGHRLGDSAGQGRRRPGGPAGERPHRGARRDRGRGRALRRSHPGTRRAGPAAGIAFVMKRAVALGLALLHAASARATDFTYQEPTVPAAPSMAGLLLRTGLALGVVIGLVYLTAWFLRKAQPGLARGPRNGPVEV